MGKIAGFMIGLVLFSLIVVGGQEFAKGFKTNYDVDIDENWSEPYDYLGNMTTIGSDMESILNSKDTNWVVGGVRMGWSVLKNALALPKFMKGVLTQTMVQLNLPPWIEAYIGVIIVITLVMVIVASLLRWYV